MTILLLGGFEQAANSDDKNSKKLDWISESLERTLDYWKLPLAGCGYIFKKSVLEVLMAIKKRADNPIIVSI